MAPMARAQQVLDCLTRRFVEQHGDEALLPSRKEPYSHEVVGTLRAMPAGLPAGGAHSTGATCSSSCGVSTSFSPGLAYELLALKDHHPST